MMRLRLVFFVVSLMLAGASISAQEQETTRETITFKDETPVPGYLKASVLAYAAGATADDIITWDGVVNHGFRERNHIGARFDRRPALFAAVGLSTEGAGTWLWVHYVGRHHPRLAAVGLIVAGGVHAYFARQNWNNAILYLRSPH